MKITKEEVAYVAHLARLDFSDKEKETFTSQLNEILQYMDVLGRVDTAGVEPMSHAISTVNALRDDDIRESLGTERALANAPDGAGECFRVPRVIE